MTKTKKKSKKQSRKRKTFKSVEAVTVILAAVFVISFFSFVALALMEYIDMNEYLEADVISIINTNVILGNNCTAIIAQTSQERARSIELGLEDKIEIRPNTHDLFTDVLRNFNITLEFVTLDDFEDGIYYATIHLKRGNEKLRLDSKPSDAIAIALRAESPVYVKKVILQNQGQNICK
jgi:bifunctional DNase/RNase